MGYDGGNIGRDPGGQDLVSSDCDNSCFGMTSVDSHRAVLGGTGLEAAEPPRHIGCGSSEVLGFLRFHLWSWCALLPGLIFVIENYQSAWPLDPSVQEFSFSWALRGYILGYSHYWYQEQAALLPMFS